MVMLIVYSGILSKMMYNCNVVMVNKLDQQLRYKYIHSCNTGLGTSAGKGLDHAKKKMVS